MPGLTRHPCHWSGALRQPRPFTGRCLDPPDQVRGRLSSQRDGPVNSRDSQSKPAVYTEQRNLLAGTCPTSPAAARGILGGSRQPAQGVKLMKILLWILVIIFLIGLAVVLGLGSLIF
jgi:hypothetical protein